jgi:hypothetical protein
VGGWTGYDGIVNMIVSVILSYCTRIVGQISRPDGEVSIHHVR